MMRCTLPWAASRGATRKPMTSPATRASTTSHPSVRVIGSPLEDRVEREHADGDEADGAEHDDAGQGREMSSDVEIEKDAEQHEHDRFDEQHQQQVARELA